MRRLVGTGRAGGERGAVAIIFALLLVALIGFIGLAVDLGAMYAKRQELQVAADAAALAAAQECAIAGCEGASGVATDYATRNTYDPLTSVVTKPGANVVQVDVYGTQERWFLPVLGADSLGPVEATAYATWVVPQSATISLPITFSMCDFEDAGGTSGLPTVFFVTKPTEIGCDWGSDGNAMPGGFGIIGEGECEVYVDVADPWVPVKTGASLPCDGSHLDKYLNKVILLPIFDECQMGKKGDPYCPRNKDLGSSEREYHIYSFAALRLLEYSFPSAGTTTKNCGADIKGNESCIKGEFVEWVSIEAAPEYSGEAPDLGATVVTLIDPRDIP
ncbi:pilus assembly protein TadG-related protein [Ornithinimicrobium cryptoxanthini]|uniref:pilus assembly protein TadG-related protein n=1 Tax=Ornithinimicrobium cryptoxanthini TaxID=2934161 RepID=UPI002117C778|nr:pilus assembly protein TadG-related protein [Ornithinimicrobium cryptoxanthini]